MGRGDGQQQASSQGLLFGPRRERPAREANLRLPSQEQRVRRGEALLELLTDGQFRLAPDEIEFDMRDLLSNFRHLGDRYGFELPWIYPHYQPQTALAPGGAGGLHPHELVTAHDRRREPSEARADVAENAIGLLRGSKAQTEILAAARAGDFEPLHEALAEILGDLDAVCKERGLDALQIIVLRSEATYIGDLDDGRAAQALV